MVKDQQNMVIAWVDPNIDLVGSIKQIQEMLDDEAEKKLDEMAKAVEPPLIGI